MSTIVIEILKDAAHWKISSFYRSESIGHRHYSIWKADEHRIETLSADIYSVLNRTDAEGKITPNSLEEFRKSAHLLYNQVFPQEVKEELRSTESTHLIFYIDEQLVHIPWELLYDGQNYLCLRFAVGRIVLTSRKIHSESIRSIQPKLKVLAVCDPAGNLKKAYDEGIYVRDVLDQAKKRVEVELRTTDVQTKYAMKNIKEFDIFHFAGHAEYNSEDPKKSGLLFKDGPLTAENIAKLSGLSSMPILVFANACSSGETSGWEIEPEQNRRIYGMANAFLLSGVRHYIGTFWKVQDGLSMEFAREFYNGIKTGKSMGESLKLARQNLIERHGESSLAWASYMLYGDPDDYLLFIDEEERHKRLTKARIGALAVMILLGLASYFIYDTFIKDDLPKEELTFEKFENIFYIGGNDEIRQHPQKALFNMNIAEGKHVYSSSVENDYLNVYAVDGDPTTRWSSRHSDPQWLYVDLGEMHMVGQVRILWEAAFGRSFAIQVSHDAERWRTVWWTRHGTSRVDVADLKEQLVPARYVRLYLRERGTDWGYSLWEFEVYARRLPNVAAGKDAIASSGDGYYAAEKAIDDDMGTRWGSQYLDPQWLSIDLGRPYRINMFTLNWERAYGMLYKIQYSNDNREWEDACVIKNDIGLLNTLYFEKPFEARYVRFYGMKRATEWGYSLWEFKVHGMKMPEH